MHIGKILKNRREELLMSQPELSKRSGIPLSSIQHIESCSSNTNPSFGAVGAICRALDLTFDEVLRKLDADASQGSGNK